MKSAANSPRTRVGTRRSGCSRRGLARRRIPKSRASKRTSWKTTRIVGGNGWNGYGRDGKWFGHFSWEYEADADGWCYYGVDWSPKGYTFYANGKKVGEQNSPVSHVEQFVLVSTEPRGYRNAQGNDGGLSSGSRVWGKPAPELFKAVLPDYFEVDFVRVYDEVPDKQ